MLLKTKYVFILINLYILIFSGCASLKKQKVSKIASQKEYKDTEIIKKANLNQNDLSNLKKQLESVKKSLIIQLYPKININKKITIDTKDAPIEDTFRVIAEKGNFGVSFDFIFDDTKTKTVTAFFKQITIGDVIKKLSKSLHLCYTFKDNILILKDYVTISVNLPVFLFNDQAKFESDIIQIDIDNKFNDDLKKDLAKIVEDENNILINPRTGLVYLKGKPEQIVAALIYLENLRNKLLEYLFVKIYIIKVNTLKAKELGIDFDKIIKTNDSNIDIHLSPGLPIASSISAVISNKKLNLILKALSQNNIGEIISSPFLMIRNNTMAGIRIVSQVGWIEPGDVDVVTGGNTSSTTQDKPTFKTMDVGINISLYPKKITDNIVQILLSIKDTSLEKFITYPWQPAPGIEPITLQYPLISKREFTTQIIAESNKYIILGGFKEHQKNKNYTDSPVINHIPLLNKFAFYSKKQHDIKDLYIIMSFSSI